MERAELGVWYLPWTWGKEAVPAITAVTISDVVKAEAERMYSLAKAAQENKGWVDPIDLYPAGLPSYYTAIAPASEGGAWSWLGDLVTTIKELVPAALETWKTIETGQVASELERYKAKLALDQAIAMQEQKTQPPVIIEKIKEVPWGIVAAIGAVGLGVFLIVRK